MTEREIEVRDLIARHLSNMWPPSIAAKRRAERIVNSLKDQGYVIAKVVNTKRTPFVIDDGEQSIEARRMMACNLDCIIDGAVIQCPHPDLCRPSNR